MEAKITVNEIGKDKQVGGVILGRSIMQHEKGTVEIREILKTICNRMGFPSLDIIKILTAASELTRSIHDLTASGTVIYDIVEEKGKKGLKITFNTPRGDIQTLNDTVHKNPLSKEGFEVSLTGAKKLMDEFFVDTNKAAGTTITVIKWLNSNMAFSEDLIEHLKLEIAQFSEKSTVETLKSQNREILDLMNELRQKYQQLEESNTQLTAVNKKLETVNSELEERTKALEKAQEKIVRQERLAAIGKLAGIVSHELRNPLGVITNSIYFLMLKVPAADAKIIKHLKIIQEESLKATKIISDLLDFARLTPEKSFKVNIQSLLKETLEQIQKPEKINIQINFDNNLPFVLLNPRKIQQVFQNIIINAFQAMLGGGELKISAIYNKDMIEIAFKDTGVGIPSENLQRLFEPLFSTKIKGIGLGLVIAKEIVENYKGKIEVESAVGAGSTFTIKIPVLDSNGDLKSREA